MSVGVKGRVYGYSAALARFGGSPQGPQRRYVSVPGHRPDELRELRAEREKGVTSGARGDLRFELVQDRARGLQVGECLVGQDDQAPPAAAGMVLAAHVAAFLQVGDELPGGLLGDAEAIVCMAAGGQATVAGSDARQSLPWAL
jgi:hypothetical protein